jgi:hypothetical protein
VSLAFSVGAEPLAALPDPTRPPAQRVAPVAMDPEPTVQSWRVTAIRISTDARRALVNDHWVGIGAEVDLARVVDIRANAVILDHDGQRIPVSLLHTDPKTSVGSRP